MNSVPTLATTPSVLAVTTHQNGVGVWALRDHGGDAALGSGARKSWDDVQVALTRSLPVLWQSITDHAALPALCFVNIWTERGFPQRVAVVDGPSFGLAFALLLTSRLSGIPVPETVIAIAGVEPTGRVSAIGGLADKIKAIMETSPCVNTVVVAAEQDEDARTLCRGRVRILGVRNLGEACDSVFGDRLVDKLLQLGGDPLSRTRIVESLFRVALKGRGEFLDWTPIERAAEIALTKWLNVPEDDQWTLQFVRGVAARHQRNAGAIPVPRTIPEHWPRALWLEVLAHLLQQAADSGEPSPERVLSIAAKELPHDLRRGLAQELRVAGALGRLEAVTGAPARALERQSAIAQIQRESYAWQEMSRPLAEWLRLAGACGDAASFKLAEESYREADAYRAIDQNGIAYVSLSWARGAVMLGLDRGDAVRFTLDSLACDATVPDHVRWSAARWLARQYLQMSRVPEADQEIRVLDRAAAPDARAARLLAYLDRAVLLNEGVPSGVIDEFRDLEPGVVGHLLNAAPRASEADYLTRFYPY